MMMMRSRTRQEMQVRCLRDGGACKRIIRLWSSGEIRAVSLHRDDGRLCRLYWFSAGGTASLEATYDVFGSIDGLRAEWHGAEINRTVVRYGLAGIKFLIERVL